MDSARSPQLGVMLRGVDRAAFAVTFALRLRAAGVPVGLTAVEIFTRALAATVPRSVGALYWTARISLVRRQSELTAFDAVFAAVFDDAVLALDPNSRRRSPAPVAAGSDDAFASIKAPAADDEAGSGLPWVTLPPAVDTAEDSESELLVPLRLPSELAGLADVPFERLAPDELRQLGDWLAVALRHPPLRRTRRMAPHRSGSRIAIRLTLARARRTGWEPIELVQARPVSKPRRIVMLCDVSQSMQAQVPAYFQLMRALVLTGHAEVFAFGTGLTRLTAVLAHRSADEAMALATASVPDRFGGTRIAANLQTLMTGRHGGLVRGAIVLIGSDGWDSGEPAELAAAMVRLRRRAHRVLWMNPRAGAEGFAPLVSSMAAALPSCDRLLPAGDFAALFEVVAELGRGEAMNSRARISSTA